MTMENGIIDFGAIFNRERIDSVIMSIQISNDSQTRTDLGDKPVTLIFNIGMVCQN